LTRYKAVKRAFYGLLFSTGFFLLSGCGLLMTTPNPLQELPIPRHVELTDVPFFTQGDDLCGPASISMVLNYRGQHLTPEKLEPLIYIPGRKGSLQAEMLAVTRRFGYIPYVIKPNLTALAQEINSGNPVVILQNLGLSWYPKWHYAVVVGYDIDRDIFILRTGDTSRKEMSRHWFMRYWAGSGNWAMVAMPPDQLPATAEEHDYVSSVAALERLSKWSQIATAYQTAIKAWPKSFFAHLGLGTAYYHQHKLALARDNYLKAVELQPDSAVAHNNLAQTLLELGQVKLARQHALKAVSLGGKSADQFRQTLQEIDSAKSN
jgi:hypothetical protein